MLTVDGGNVIAESDETNNVWTSLPFEIINEEELYADDVDRDGVPNDLDGCPNTPVTLPWIVLDVKMQMVMVTLMVEMFSSTNPHNGMILMATLRRQQWSR